MDIVNRVILSRSTARVILILSVLLTAMAWQGASHVLEQRLQDRFTSQSNALRDALLDRLSNHQMLLRGGAGLFSASKTVARDEWHKYTQSLDIPHICPDIQGLGYIQASPARNLQSHEALIRA